MNVKVPMIEVGIASAAMKVTRRLRMNRKTTTLASRPPRIRCSLMSSNDRRMKRDWSLPMLIWMSGGSVRLDALEPRQDAIDHFDGVGARLLADLHADRRRAARGASRCGSPATLSCTRPTSAKVIDRSVGAVGR